MSISGSTWQSVLLPSSAELQVKLRLTAELDWHCSAPACLNKLFKASSFDVMFYWYCLLPAQYFFTRKNMLYCICILMLQIKHIFLRGRKCNLQFFHRWCLDHVVNLWFFKFLPCWLFHHPVHNCKLPTEIRTIRLELQTVFCIYTIYIIWIYFYI